MTKWFTIAARMSIKHQLSSINSYLQLSHLNRTQRYFCSCAHDGLPQPVCVKLTLDAHRHVLSSVRHPPKRLLLMSILPLRSLVLSFSGFVISRTVTQRSLQLPPYFQLIFSSHTRKPALRAGPRREILSPAGVWSPFNIFLPRILFSAARRTTSLEQRNPDRLSPGRV